MKKMVALFAHPDDEAFGPGGTIAKMSREYEITVICVTGGEAGKNVTSDHIRKKELETSAQILGVKKVICLDFKDGELSNNKYHKLADVLTKKLSRIKPEVIMTFDMNL